MSNTVRSASTKAPAAGSDRSHTKLFVGVLALSVIVAGLFVLLPSTSTLPAAKAEVDISTPPSPREAQRSALSSLTQLPVAPSSPTPSPSTQPPLTEPASTPSPPTTTPSPPTTTPSPPTTTPSPPTTTSTPPTETSAATPPNVGLSAVGTTRGRKCLRRKRSSVVTTPPLANLTKFNARRRRTDTCRVLDPTGGYGWKFVQYEPSTLEKHWKVVEAPVDRISPGLCPLWVNNFTTIANQINMTIYYHMKNNTATMASVCTEEGGSVEDARILPHEYDHAVFSRYRYEYECIRPPCALEDKPAHAPALGTVRYSYIEPLVGPMRHPFYCHNRSRYLEDKDYMMMNRWDVIRTHDVSERNFYFDVGASSWNRGIGGPSQTWFYERFAELCARFTDFYAWEARGIDPKVVFSEAPGLVQPHYHWYNIPVTVGAGAWSNPNNHVLAEANVEDFVVYKIDFDQPTLEGTMIQQILQNKELSDLIDELYFEYHVNQDYIKNNWGTGSLKIYHQDSLALFTALRERGIRAHSWL